MRSPSAGEAFRCPHARRFGYIFTNRTNGTLYLGVTNDLRRRVFEHRSGLQRGFTQRYGLKRLVWYEHHADIREANQRERALKHWSRT